MTTPPHPRHAAAQDDEFGAAKSSAHHPRHAATPDPDTDTDKLDAAVLKTAGIVVIGVIMAILDMTVVNVAIPTFQTEFDVSFAIAAWTMTGYTLALATVIPLTGWAADRFGTKRLYILALILFVAGSVLCSMAWNIESLIAFRVIQGLGGGMLMPLAMTIMTHAAGPHRIGRVMAVLGIPMLLGPISGPILGGWLIEVATWPWIFLINLPLGIFAIALAMWGLKPDRPEPSESFDFLGMLLLSPGLALFLFGVSSIPEVLQANPQDTILDALTSGRVLISVILGIVLMVAFIPHAFRTEHPLIDLNLFKNKDLTAAVICFIFFTIAFMGSMLLIPAYLLQVRGESTLSVGLMLAPQGLGAMLTMPVAGALTDKIGARKDRPSRRRHHRRGHGFLHADRSRHTVLADPDRAVRLRTRNGLHDDAADVGSHRNADPQPGRSWFDADEHREPGRRLDRYGAHVDDPDREVQRRRWTFHLLVARTRRRSRGCWLSRWAVRQHDPGIAAADRHAHPEGLRRSIVSIRVHVPDRADSDPPDLHPDLLPPDEGVGEAGGRDGTDAGALISC